MSSLPASPEFQESPITYYLRDKVAPVAKTTDEVHDLVARKLNARGHEVIPEDMRPVLRELYSSLFSAEGFSREAAILEACRDYLFAHRRTAPSYPLLVALFGEPSSTPWAISTPSQYHVRFLATALGSLVWFEPGLVRQLMTLKNRGLKRAVKLWDDYKTAFQAAYGWIDPETCFARPLMDSVVSFKPLNEEVDRLGLLLDMRQLTQLTARGPVRPYDKK